MLPDKTVINGILFAVVFMFTLYLVWGCEPTTLPIVNPEQAEQPANILGVF